jgi:uncharacterized membrane protein YkvA (DUF1232 family)
MRPRRTSARSRLTRAVNLLAFAPLAPRAPLYGRLLLALVADPRVPLSRKALLALAAAYVASPVDVLPDRLPLVGALDDVAVVVLAVDLFLEGLPAGLVDEKLVDLGIPRSELDADLKRVRKAVPGPVRSALARVPEAIEAIGVIAHRTGLDQRLRSALAGGRAATQRSSRPRPMAASAMPTTHLEEIPA